jgi:four helix bundle protein
MTPITRFEDLIAWQEARSLIKSIYQLTGGGAFAKDYGMRDQIQRASVSVMTNIAEGFDCESTADFARFLGIARRSAVEVQSLLYAALILNIQRGFFPLLYEQARKCRSHGPGHGIRRILYGKDRFKRLK